MSLLATRYTPIQETLCIHKITQALQNLQDDISLHSKNIYFSQEEKLDLQTIFQKHHFKNTKNCSLIFLTHQNNILATSQNQQTYFSIFQKSNLAPKITCPLNEPLCKKIHQRKSKK